MKKIFIIPVVISIILLTTLFAGCELFNNPPAHDNILDPAYESTGTDNGEWLISASSRSTADTIILAWTVNEDNVITKIKTNYYIHWNTTDDINNASKSVLIDGTGVLAYTIEGLVYGLQYYIWIQGVAAEDLAGFKTGEELFIKQEQRTPTTKGESDPGFNLGQPLSNFFTTSPNYPDCRVNYITADGQNFYASGFRDEPAGEQFGDWFVRYISAAGQNITSFSDDGELTINSSSYPGSNKLYPTIRSSGLISFRGGSNRPFYLLGDNPAFLDAETEHGITDLRMKSVVKLSDDSFIFGGGKQNGAWLDLRIYHASADLDSSSGNFSETTSSYSGGTADESMVTDLALSPAENYVYACGYFNSALGLFATRLNCPALTEPNNFDLSAGGLWANTVDSTDGNQQIAVDGSGRIYLAGKEVIGRFGTNCAPDNTFGSANNGTVGTAVLDSGFQPTEMIIQPDDKILLCGYTPGSGIVYRLNTDGSLDLDFGEEGGTAGKFIRDDYKFLDMDVTTAGRIIIGGEDTSTSSPKGTVFCLR